MKILQINVSLNSGSTGRITEDIGKVMMLNGFESSIAFGRTARPSTSEKIRVGDKLDFYSHVIKSLFFDRHGFASKSATTDLIQKIKDYKPDVIGLHNLHGYYLHVGVLFEFLKEYACPVVWTFHDCWPFTGHCSHFEKIDCQKWKSHCNKCPLTAFYPQSYIVDNSFKNFVNKKNSFTNHPNLTIITPSNWLAALVKQSFLKEYSVQVIHNGTNLEIFKPRGTENNSIVLGVASVWTKSKGLDDFIQLRKILDFQIEIVLIGLSKKQIKVLPKGILGIEKTESLEQLAVWYSKASVFINPTYADNFPTTNIEALACGTPVITYNTGGSPEAIDHETGVVVDKGDILGLERSIHELRLKDQNHLSLKCRERAEKYFNKNERFTEYLILYQKLINK
jgi:glycosyltransferase involved in cell wall biosynthesis